MIGARASEVHVEPAYESTIRDLRLEGPGIFEDPRIHVWRSIPERENCTLDATLADGRQLRLHIKRYRTDRSAARDEARGITLLNRANIPTVPLVAWGALADGRSFLITEDLLGYRPADKLVEEGAPFTQLLEPTASLAARLHSAGLHHRDLYLCHFFVRLNRDSAELRLIDAGRVRRLPLWPLARRWVIKDLAQFWYSAMGLGVPEEQRLAWLRAYGNERGIASESLLPAVQRKMQRIARHDAHLRLRQPRRNISLPEKTT